MASHIRNRDAGDEETHRRLIAEAKRCEEESERLLKRSEALLRQAAAVEARLKKEREG